MSKFRYLRNTTILVWFLVVVFALFYFFLHPEQFTAVYIADTLRRYSRYIIALFLIVSVARAFVLIPSTPFVLAGVLLMPETPTTSLIISMLGIAISCTLIYFFSEALNFRAFFLRHRPDSLHRIARLLRGPSGFFYLVFWSFFPAAPTDLACYVAGTIQMPYFRFLTAICLGELVICSLYVYLGRGLWDFFL